MTLTCQNPAHHIRYTLNGSAPDRNAKLYTGPLSLNTKMRPTSDIYKILVSPENEFYLPDSVEKAIVIRAAAFDEQENRVSPVVTQSYFVKSLGCDLHKLPVVSICADSLALFDHDTGIFVPGVFCDPEDMDNTGNYAQHGEEWERVVNVEFYADGNDGFNQIAGLRTHGGIRARRAQQKGLKLYAREEYGKKNFKYRIFETTELQKFKHLVLKPFRNGCTPAGVQDWLANQIAAPLNMGVTASRPVVLFLNGEYWGIYFIEEKVDERYIESHYNVDHDSVNIIAAWGALEHGSADDYWALYNWLSEADLSDPLQYHYIVGKIDIPNIIDYFLFELYSANWDWPYNNVRCWQANGSLWNWIFYDGDCCFDKPDYDSYLVATFTGTAWNTSAFSTLFFRKLLESDEFLHQYLTRFEQVSSQFFPYRKTKPYLNAIFHELEKEIPEQSHRFKTPESVSEWKSSCQEIDEFLATREEKFWLQTMRFFGLNDTVVSSLSCYPNPITQGIRLNLLIMANEDGISRVDIYDLNGRHVCGQYYSLQQGKNLIPVETGAMSGIYLVKAGNETRKIVIKNR